MKITQTRKFKPSYFLIAFSLFLLINNFKNLKEIKTEIVSGFIAGYNQTKK